MSEMKHTPGPWTQDGYGFVLDTNSRNVVVEGLALGSRSTDETRANARLIAAAPELLEVVELLVNMAATGMCDFNQHDEYVMSKAKKLLAKAKGENV